MTPLEEVLSGREERFALQNEWLSSGDGFFVVQIALNVPGYPKRLPNDVKAVAAFRALLLGRSSAAPRGERTVENGAGVCWQGAFDSSLCNAAVMKRLAVAAESETPAGRALDIDVITKDGPLSRAAMGLPERSCLLCGAPAKVCARSRRHSAEELRARVAELLEGAERVKGKK